MYHPHLFARRAELLALRDLAMTLPVSATISPILEPVKSDPRDLKRAMQVLGDAGLCTSVIVNPIEGDFKVASELEPWKQSVSEGFSEYASMIPALVCRPSTTATQIAAFLASYPDRDVAILYWSPTISDQTLAVLAQNTSIRFHMNILNQMSAARRAILPSSRAVDIRDHFAKCDRNADYPGPEFFSDDHLTYSINACGFGDYSITGARYVAGGGQAHAVAIHGMYKLATGSFWLEHFISDDTDLEVGTIEGKYLQAANKLIGAVSLRPLEYGNDAALAAFGSDVENSTFPGLAASKRRQIYHHLALVHETIAVS